ncbi:glycosyltransferase family 2 protein [Phaeovulum sp. NW3]|uniref:glycosyltransferase family 2 protein n=1 Tax=Phaeovulum sp. NW3 TaxID=2934933 RepID=UPI0020228549|nr:glycosyltransferase family 2 protein [Phaeovulum sp. NW3]MCL7466827.1 glycosyltransferase family 2 protein [Phaeovulum sp. NW3]
MLNYEVVTLTIEAEDRIRFFLDHYLRSGAAKITLFHDGDAPRKDFGDRVTVIHCDETFWASVEGGRPGTVEARQRCIYGLAYERCSADWLLVVDTDEFIVGFKRIENAVKKLPTPPEAVRIPSAEAIFLSEDGLSDDFSARHFRIPQNKYLAQLLPRALYPGNGPLFIRGLLGHSIGKQFIKTGLEGIQIGIHSIFRQEIPVPPLCIVDYTPNNGVFMCHFDAISYPQWKEKWDRRIRNRDTAEMGAKRDRQMELYLQKSALGEDALIELFRDLYGVSPRKLQVMKTLGLAFEFAEISSQAQRHFQK